MKFPNGVNLSRIREISGRNHRYNKQIESAKTPIEALDLLVGYDLVEVVHVIKSKFNLNDEEFYAAFLEWEK